MLQKRAVSKAMKYIKKLEKKKIDQLLFVVYLINHQQKNITVVGKINGKISKKVLGKMVSDTTYFLQIK